MRNGQEYLKADNAQVAVKINKMRLHFDNLFNGDKVLGDLGNSVVNQNIETFISDVEPPLQKSLGMFDAHQLDLKCEIHSLHNFLFQLDSSSERRTK
jgi:Haemolymph juvenile hormone binding protein (JHBP)